MNIFNEKEGGNKEYIVLTADRTLMTEYNGFVDLGQSACLPSKLLPNSLRYLLYKRLRKGICTYAIRRVESKLIDEGYNVITLHPQEIHKIKKIKPKIVGISVVDPLSRKPHSWTLNNILGGGNSVTENEFSKLLIKINQFKKKGDFKIFIGGPGACEFDNSDKYSDLFDSYVVGSGEGAIDLFKKAMNGEPLPKRIIADHIKKEKDLSIIKKPARLGAVQITQGCPRNCDFCAVATQEWISFSKERIIKEVKVNLTRDYGKISLITEDIMLYGAKDVRVNHDAIVKLMESLAKVKKEKEFNRISFSDASVAAIIDGKKTVDKITDILNITEYSPVSPVLGIETGSKRLIRKYMDKKTKPYSPDKWPDLVKEAINKLDDNNWYPVCNLITGLPDETEEDVIDTINLVDDLKDNRVVFYIFHFSPCEGTKLEGSKFFNIESLDERRWELYIKCWTYSLERVKKDIQKFLGNKILRIALLVLINHLEQELYKYQKNPHALADKYSKLNLHGFNFFSYLSRSFFGYNEKPL
jgi:radical SAM superfamily enzyme YgiQ (UPF0313 family)